MSSKSDNLVNFLTGMFAVLSFVAFLAFLLINYEISRVQTDIAFLKGTPGKGYESVRENLIVAIEKVSRQYSSVNESGLTLKPGYKEKYADVYGKVHGVFPNIDPYMEGGVAKPFIYIDENGNEIQDSGLIKNIERSSNSRKDESETGDGFLRISTEEINKQPAIIKEQNQIIGSKINDIGNLDKHIVDIKIEADREVKNMREEYVIMNNGLNEKVDGHIKSMDKKARIHEEMVSRLHILQRKDFEIVTYEDLLKLDRDSLEIEAAKEKLKRTQHLDHEQLAEAVFKKRVIDGTITDVAAGGKSFIIDIGERNGVKVGQIFEIFELKDGVKKILHGKLTVKTVDNYFSMCSPLIEEDGKLPLVVSNYFVGDFQFTPNEKFEYILVGEFKGQYTQEELLHIIKSRGGIIKDAIGYSANYLVLGERPGGDYPSDEITERMKDDSLYNKKTMVEIQKEYGFSEEVTRYVVLFESSKEMGVKILDEKKLLTLLKN